jgi:hypothetical protein
MELFFSFLTPWLSGEEFIPLRNEVLETGQIFGSLKVKPEGGCCIHELLHVLYDITKRKGKIIFLGGNSGKSFPI